MSTNQLSIEKKTNDFKITSFAFLQVSILLFAPSLGLWIVRLMRAAEYNQGIEIVVLFHNLAIGFTIAFAVALIITLITYFIYYNYRKKLDNAIDNSIANLRKNNAEDAKPRININLNQAPVAPATPQKSVVQINAKPAVNNGPIKKVVTTTTTTRPTGPSPRPGMNPMGARPVGAAPRPGVSPMGPRPTGPAPRPGMNPMGARPVGAAPRPGVSPMGPRPTGPSPRPGVSPIKK